MIPLTLQLGLCLSFSPSSKRWGASRMPTVCLFQEGLSCWCFLPVRVTPTGCSLRFLFRSFLTDYSAVTLSFVTWLAHACLLYGAIYVASSASPGPPAFNFLGTFGTRQLVVCASTLHWRSGSLHFGAHSGLRAPMQVCTVAYLLGARTLAGEDGSLLLQAGDMEQARFGCIALALLFACTCLTVALMHLPVSLLATFAAQCLNVCAQRSLSSTHCLTCSHCFLRHGVAGREFLASVSQL